MTSFFSPGTGSGELSQRNSMLKPILAAAVVVAALLPAPAYAGKPPAKRGDACTTVGEVRKDRSGDRYICVRRAGDPCPVWHSRDPKPGPWPSRKTPDCPTCTTPTPVVPTPPVVTPPATPPAVPAPVDVLTVTG